MPHHIFDLIEVYRYFKSSLPFVGKDCPSKDMSVHILTQTLPSPPKKNNIYCQTNVSRKKQPHYLYVQEHLQCTERRNQHGLLRDFFFFSVNLREVREVRDGKNSKDFDRWPEEARKYDPSVCFVILYGNDFKLKTLSVAGKSPP